MQTLHKNSFRKLACVVGALAVLTLTAKAEVVRTTTTYHNNNGYHHHYYHDRVYRPNYDTRYYNSGPVGGPTIVIHP